MFRRLVAWMTSVLLVSCLARFAAAMLGLGGDWAFRGDLVSVGMLSVATGLASIAWLAVGKGHRWTKFLLVFLGWPILLLLIVIFPPLCFLRTIDGFVSAKFQHETDQKVVALTIDDAIDPDTTPRLLDLLDKHGVQATFFVMTDTIAEDEKSSSIVERIAAGHEIGNHQTSDRPAYRMSAEEFAADVRVAQKKLETFVTVRWMRPGAGFFTPSKARAAHDQGLQLVLGSVFPWDSHQASVNFSVRFITARVHSGSIVVLHDGGVRGERTIQVLEQVLPKLKAEGYRITTLRQLAALPEID